MAGNYAMYGLVHPSLALVYARAVCDAVNDLPSTNALSLLLETAAQETRLGTYRDPTPYGAGTGLCQFDRIGFDDVKERTSGAWRTLIKVAFDIDIKAVEYRELEESPLLNFIFCRLKYRLVPEAIPSTVEGRAAYWKRYYNTVAGKGTVEEYIANAALAAALLEKSACLCKP